MKFRPLHDRVVVCRVEEDSKTKGGIIIPDGFVNLNNLAARFAELLNAEQPKMRAFLLN